MNISSGCKTSSSRSSDSPVWMLCIETDNRSGTVPYLLERAQNFRIFSQSLLFPGIHPAAVWRFITTSDKSSADGSWEVSTSRLRTGVWWTAFRKCFESSFWILKPDLVLHALFNVTKFSTVLIIWTQN